VKSLCLILGLIVGSLGVVLSSTANVKPLEEMASIEDVRVALLQRDAALEGLARAITQVMTRVEALEKKK
jgi:hypothetical protein